METISLKALSRKVLERNLKGNSRETEAKRQGNLEAKKEGESFHVVHDGNMTETDLQKMPLSDFEKVGLILKVWSEVLKEPVYFVSSEAVLNRSPLDAVAYTGQELQAMLDMAPEEVKAAHEVKRVFHKTKVIEHRKGAVNG